MRTFLVKTLFIGGMLALLTACTDTTLDDAAVENSAYVPIYMNPVNITEARYTSAKPITNAGKQYVFGNTLYQNELNEGIHIIDVSNPAAPQKLGFLEVPLSTEVALKDGFLYTNNYQDLVVFDLTAPENPRLVKRFKNVFPPANQVYPPFFNVLFECSDTTKGVVVRWELRNNVKANCRR